MKKRRVRKPRRIIKCACCGKVGMYHAWGWIQPCYNRWQKADMPAGGPPPFVTKEELVKRRTGMKYAQKALNKQELLRLIKLSHGTIEVTAAARRLGVSTRTCGRYKKELREEGLIES